MSFIRLLPYLLYFFGIGFDISASVSVAGMGLHQESIAACRGAMYVCLVFYCAVKVCVQLFLIERAYAIRKSSGKKRLDDPLWLLFMLVVILGFGTIVILAFMAPVGIVDEGDGQCRIGLPQTSVLVLLTYDILINLALTGVFVMLLRPLFRRRSIMPEPGIGLSAAVSRYSLRSMFSTNSIRKLSSPASSIGRPVSPSSPANMKSPINPVSPNWPVDSHRDRLKTLLVKSLFGALVMLTATIINLSLLYRYDGQEHGWICYLCCLIDGKPVRA
ncbi:hypothetical protein LTR08_001695 [Meristemomyces frigidus]|nr:hypothetical protein LTR08_001695 [Meristemomyces frigidus]